VAGYTGTIPPSSDPAAVIELGTLTLPAIDRMAQTVPLDRPPDAPNAGVWDSITTETWAEQNIHGANARKLFALAVEAILSVEPRDVSFLYLLFYVHSAGSIEVLVDNAGTGGAQDFRVSGGTQRIAVTLADSSAAEASCSTIPCVACRRVPAASMPTPTGRRSQPSARLWRSRPTWPGGSPTCRARRRSATSSPSGCRSAR